VAAIQSKAETDDDGGDAPSIHGQGYCFEKRCDRRVESSVSSAIRRSYLDSACFFFPQSVTSFLSTPNTFLQQAIISTTFTMAPKILVVLTSADKFEAIDHPTGWYLVS
jgi:hypothetical protein